MGANPSCDKINLAAGKNMNATTTQEYEIDGLSLEISGNVVVVIALLIAGGVMLFFGLYMIDRVYNVTNLPNTSVFYESQTQNINTIKMVMSVGGIILMAVGFGYAIQTFVGGMGVK
jgi:cytochrome b subunit of formate dehydrogenase